MGQSAAMYGGGADVGAGDPTGGQGAGTASESGGPASESGGPPSRGTARTRTRMVAAVIALALLIGFVGGPVAIAVPVLACLAYWRPRWLPWVAFGAMVLAGVVAATGHPWAMGSGAFSGLAQVCALVALAATLIPYAASTVSATAGPATAGPASTGPASTGPASTGSATAGPGPGPRDQPGDVP